MGATVLWVIMVAIIFGGIVIDSVITIRIAIIISKDISLSVATGVTIVGATVSAAVQITVT